MASRYTEADHKRAYMHWKSGDSLRELSEKEGMPSRELLSQWSRDWDCDYDCKYHNWRERHENEIDQALEELEEELPDPVERDKQRLRNLNQTEKRLFDRLQSGELEEPRTMKEVVELLERVLQMNRLLRGESTEITEMRGADNRTLNVTDVLNQLNVGEDVTEEELVEAAEKATIEGDNGED